ncbi:hypothetical protein N7493_009682 [Penicillium malachiteum]|uniref:Uncharacterized protein n=1 Tax=Penicillium malachiteum TaxID=1324776 RepID=A0AAD6MSE9_9EURO|nr:hypothetical protein N7493_009682 [Penicillium malachiteum]
MSDTPALSRIACLFTGLQRLYINLSTLGSGIPRGIAHNHVLEAIRVFPPLQYLRVRSLHSAKELHRILECHGETLKGLIIEPDIGLTRRDSLFRKSSLTFNVSDIHQLVQACPDLEELRVQIRKPTDDRHLGIYKTLGNFPKLKSLVLDLHYNPEPDSRILIGVYGRLLLKNAPADKELAVKIWDLINSSHNAHLQHLRIVPFGIMHHKETLRYCFGFLAPSFLATRSSNFDFPQPILEEIGDKERLIWMHEYPISREDGRSERNSDLDSDLVGLETMTVRSLFREMWPSAPSTLAENGLF